MRVQLGKLSNCLEMCFYCIEMISFEALNRAGKIKCAHGAVHL